MRINPHFAYFDSSSIVRDCRFAFKGLYLNDDGSQVPIILKRNFFLNIVHFGDYYSQTTRINPQIVLKASPSSFDHVCVNFSNKNLIFNRDLMNKKKLFLFLNQRLIYMEDVSSYYRNYKFRLFFYLPQFFVSPYALYYPYLNVVHVAAPMVEYPYRFNHNIDGYLLPFSIEVNQSIFNILHFTEEDDEYHIHNLKVNFFNLFFIFFIFFNAYFEYFFLNSFNPDLIFFYFEYFFSVIVSIYFFFLYILGLCFLSLFLYLFLKIYSICFIKLPKYLKLFIIFIKEYDRMDINIMSDNFAVF